MSQGLKIHWFGQASFLLQEDGGASFLVDPYFPHNRPPETFVHSEPPVQEKDIRINHVLLTHDHTDHTCEETCSRIHKAHPEAGFHGPPESVHRLRSIGIDVTVLHTLEAGDSKKIDDVEVNAVWSKLPEGDIANNIAAPDTTHLGYVLKFRERIIYISGDPVNTLAEISCVDAVKKLAPDTGILTTHPTEGEFPYFEGVLELARRLNLKTVIPAHYSCFVRRDFNPAPLGELLHKAGIEICLIPYNDSVTL